MVSDLQVRKLMKLLSSGMPLAKAALSVGIDAKTARKYRDAGPPPGPDRAPHTWRTRPDPFAAVWDELRAMLAVNPGLQAQTLFAFLQRQYPGQFAPGQLRTLQRQLKAWRALEGPARDPGPRGHGHERGGGTPGGQPLTTTSQAAISVAGSS